MINFNEVFEEKLRKISNMMSILPEGDFDPTAAEALFNIDVFKVNEDNPIKIITGIKTNPRGISITKADYYMFVIPSEILVVSVTDIKNYIKGNLKQLKVCLDDEFKFSGYEVSYIDLKLLGFIIKKERIEFKRAA